MAEFNYTEYLKNNPLVQEEIKEKLLTESLETTEEVTEEAPSSKTTVSALKAQIKEFILDSLSEEEKPDGMDVFFGADAKDKMKKRREDAVDFLQKHKEKYGLKEDEDEVDIEDEIEIDAEPKMDTAPEAGLSQDEQEIQNSLKLAYDNAVAIGDDKLADQIGNSITFFTRTHVVER